MEMSRFIAKVLQDGHLSLPEEIAKQKGKKFEVTLRPIDQNEVFSYTKSLAEKKGFSQYTEEDIERIIHESRGVSD